MKSTISIFLLVILGLVGSSCGNRNNPEPTGAGNAVSTTPSSSQAEVVELSTSPRHQEWVTLTSSDREFQAFVVYPENKRSAKSVLVVHENRGLNDWARLFADKLAAEGFLVIAPDLISNTQGKRRTTDFENPDAAREAIYALDPGQVTDDLNAAYTYIKSDPSATGEVAVVGFCWGGSQTFRYATNNRDISSAHVFYGTAPEDATALAKISAPVYGYYGEEDNRVNSTIDQTKEKMDAANNLFEYEIYEGAGHAFMNRAHQEDASAANKRAHDAAWERLLSLLRD